MNSDFCVGVHALVYLSHKNCCLSSEELAENICTNRVRVRRVMGRLGKAGLVDTKSGSESFTSRVGASSTTTGVFAGVAASTEAAALS